MRATPTQENLHFRLARYYLDKLSAAETAYQHGHEHSRYALALFDQEWPHIKQWRDWSAAFVDTQNEITALCQAYPLAGAEILLLRQHPQERLEWLEAGLTAAQRLADPQAEMVHLYLLGRIPMYGSPNSALDFTEKALVLARQLDDPLYTSKILNVQGNIFYSQDEYMRSKTAHEQAFALSKELNAKHEMGVALNGLGNVSLSQSDNQRAYECYIQYLKISEALGHPHDVCWALRNLGTVTRRMGDHRMATEYTERCVALCRAIGYQHGLADGLAQLGILANGQGHPSEARDYFQQSLEISRLISYSSKEAFVLYQLGSLFCELGDYPAALEYLEAALSLSTKLGERWYSALALMEISEVFRRIGDISCACLKLREGLEIACTVQSSAIRAKYLVEAVLLWHDRGQVEQAALWTGLLHEHLSKLTVEERSRYDQLHRTLEVALGQESFTSALERGKTLDLDSVIQEILNSIKEATNFSGQSPPILLKNSVSNTR